MIFRTFGAIKTTKQPLKHLTPAVEHSEKGSLALASKTAVMWGSTGDLYKVSESDGMNHSTAKSTLTWKKGCKGPVSKGG